MKTDDINTILGYGFTIDQASYEKNEIRIQNVLHLNSIQSTIDIVQDMDNGNKIFIGMVFYAIDHDDSKTYLEHIVPQHVSELIDDIYHMLQEDITFYTCGIAWQLFP
jgi:hypothetical protein